MKMKKLIAIILSVFLALWGLNIWYKVIVSGNYYLTSPWYHTMFSIIVLVLFFYLINMFARRVIQKDFNHMFTLVFISIAFSGIQSCTYSKMNQIVLYSEDCGVNWKQVSVGSRVPTGAGNMCFIKETMPGYEMQGDMDFYVLFKDQVKVKIRLTYSYMIEDPLLFMKSAKKLGKTNADADEASDDNERFEGAENRVIETKIKKVTSDEFPKQDVITHDMNALELQYVDLVNNELKARGVHVTVFEMVPDFQVLTQQAIDAANADRIYASKNMQEFGRQITIARAGATQIIVNDKNDN